MRNKILPYNPNLKELARKLRKQGILVEVLLWKQIKNKTLGVQFHRQLPIDNYIVDFYCHEIMLAIEVDGFYHFADGASEKDAIRQGKLEDLGVRFIRFNDLDIQKNIDEVLKDLRDKIKELQNTPLNPPSRGEIQTQQL
jgi:very-short-patch-repair endonuclease